MSSEMEKFVLQYSVEIRDSLDRLEKLNSKVKKTSEETNKATDEFVQFGKDAADEIGKVVPGIDKVSGAIRIMRGELAIAGVALGALAVGVKSVMTMREQYSQQRQMGMDVGVSELRLEDYQRKISRVSGGSVSREQSADQVKMFSEKLNAAFTDPTRVGTDARQLMQLGINPGSIGGRKLTTNEGMTQLATRLQGMSPEAASGLAKAMGFSQDFFLSLQRLGPQIGKVTDITEDEINRRNDAQQSLNKFNEELSKFKNEANELEIALGQRLIPAFTSLLTWINKIVDAIPKDKVATAVDNAASNQINYFKGDEKSSGSFWEEWKRHPIAGAGPLGAAYRAWIKPRFADGTKQPLDLLANNDSSAASQAKTNAATTDKNVKTADKLTGSIDRAVDAADKNNEQASQTASDMQLAVNMFSGAVSSFTNAIDEKQAWAAWAGEVGAAGGMRVAAGTVQTVVGAPVDANHPALRNNQVFSKTANMRTPYDEYYADAEKKTGIPQAILKNVSRVESSFNPKAKSSAGAVGLMQVMPANGKALGLNLNDPRENILAGAKVLANFLKIANGDMRKALTMYHGGTNQANWGPNTRAYSGKVLGEQDSSEKGSVVGGGAKRQDIQLRQVQQNIADRLGVPLQQIQFGGVTRGDAAFALSQKKAEIQNNITSLRTELLQANLTAGQRAAIMQQLRAQQSGMNAMNTYGETVANDQMAGDRTITVGERAVIINLNGVADPEQNANNIQQRLQSEIGNIVNEASSGKKL